MDTEKFSQCLDALSELSLAESSALWLFFVFGLASLTIGLVVFYKKSHPFTQAIAILVLGLAAASTPLTGKVVSGLNLATLKVETDEFGVSARATCMLISQASAAEPKDTSAGVPLEKLSPEDRNSIIPIIASTDALIWIFHRPERRDEARILEGKLTKIGKNVIRSQDSFSHLASPPVAGSSRIFYETERFESTAKGIALLAADIKTFDDIQIFGPTSNLSSGPIQIQLF